MVSGRKIAFVGSGEADVPEGVPDDWPLTTVSVTHVAELLKAQQALGDRSPGVARTRPYPVCSVPQPMGWAEGGPWGGLNPDLVVFGLPACEEILIHEDAGAAGFGWACREKIGRPQA